MRYTHCVPLVNEIFARTEIYALVPVVYLECNCYTSLLDEMYCIVTIPEPMLYVIYNH